MLMFTFCVLGCCSTFHWCLESWLTNPLPVATQLLLRTFWIVTQPKSPRYNSQQCHHKVINKTKLHAGDAFWKMEKGWKQRRVSRLAPCSFSPGRYNPATFRQMNPDVATNHHTWITNTINRCYTYSVGLATSTLGAVGSKLCSGWNVVAVPVLATDLHLAAFEIWKCDYA